MKTSTNRGHRCARQALARLAEAELFRQFQYLTVPLHVRHQVHVDSAEKVVELLPGRKGTRETGS